MVSKQENNVQGNRSVLEEKGEGDKRKDRRNRKRMCPRLYCVLCLLSADTASMLATMERLVFLYM